jgi:putative ABC transport system permease protein
VIRFSGRLRCALIIGGQGIRARKTRTLLSIVSLFLGVLAVVIVQAGAETANRAALADVELNLGKDGTLAMYLSPSQGSVHAVMGVLTGRAEGVGIFSGHAVIGEPGVAPINPGGGTFDSPGDGGYYGPYGDVAIVCDEAGNCRKTIQEPPEEPIPPGQAIELGVTALTGDILPFRPYRLQTGRWLDFSGAPSLAPRLVLNKEAAKGFGRHPVPAQMRLDDGTADATPRIIGVIDDGQTQPMAYARADEIVNWLPESSMGRMGGVQVLLSPDAPDLQRLLTVELAAAGVRNEEMHVEVIQSKKTIEARLALYRAIFLGIAGLVLLIGVAGILNVGLATVGERVEEFALRRAVGTPRTLLAGIVLAETLLTGLFTAGAAIGVAALCLKILGRQLGDRFPFLASMDFPWQAGVAGVIAGVIAGVLGGLIPAIRAARIPIATVMRA